MKSVLFICVLMSLSLVIGCAERLPGASPLTTSQVKPLRPPPFVNPPPEPIKVTNVPFKTPVLNKPIIVIDPGHGGEDFGTHSLGTPRYQEKYLNMSTAQMLKNYLQQFGYQIIMTRTDDTFISLEQRAIFANQQNPVLFVSIHYNSAPSRDAEGIEVFYYRTDPDKNRVAKSKLLAQSILDRVLIKTQAKSRGVKHGNYAVIRQTNMPAVLIEGGFLTCKSEMDKLKDASYLKSLALGIAQGIQDYLSKQNVLVEN